MFTSRRSDAAEARIRLYERSLLAVGLAHPYEHWPGLWLWLMAINPMGEHEGLLN